MLRILNKRFILVLTFILIIVTCNGCKTIDKYLIADYLSDLAYSSGISDKHDFEMICEDLYQWKVIDELDIVNKNDYLKYDFLIETINNLTNNESFFESLKENINKKYTLDEEVDKSYAQKIIKLACNDINNQIFTPNYTFIKQDNVKSIDDSLSDGDIIYDEENGKYIRYKHGAEGTDANFEDVVRELIIEDSFDVDFENIELIPYAYENKDSNYINTRFNLLSSPNKETFEYNGYTIYYDVTKAGIKVNISKKKDNGSKLYADININKIQPSVKWHYQEGDITNAYFRLNFNTNEKIGFNSSKYQNYYLDFKELDATSFRSLLRSTVRKKDNAVDTSIPLFKIKIPMEAIPTAFIYLDVNINLSAEGKLELVLTNSHNIGFEIKDGHARFINDHERDYDFIAQASAKTGLGVKMSLEMINKSLMDINVNGGINASLSTTLHLYDEEGNKTQEKIDLAYDAVNDIAKENNDVKVCGDISFNWYADLLFNSSSTLLYKHGLTKKINLLNEDNQVFGNMHHLENGHFVKRCTREERNKTKIESQEINSEKLILEKTGIVLKNNETYNINLKHIPKEYSLNDLIYESEDNSIVEVNNASLKALNKGNTRVLIKTKDNKYQTYLKVLVSE